MVEVVGMWKRERWRRVDVRMGRRDQFLKIIVVDSRIFEVFHHVHAIACIVKRQLNSPYILSAANTAQPPSLDIHGDGCGRGVVSKALALPSQGLFVR
mmetsp:Transcript_14473/g.28949  ORF Transcript_14473/g.28949 Transcript_14473/m.28949 type:complete len:98 (-) Transcript_14473:78-371(-)